MPRQRCSPAPFPPAAGAAEGEQRGEVDASLRLGLTSLFTARRPRSASSGASFAVGDALARAWERLARAGVDEPRLVAELLLARALGRARTWLHAHPEATVPTDAAGRFAALVARAARHEPLAYILGVREFYGHTFLVRSGVLVPRPETEVLVEVALARLQRPEPRVADVGCGCGAVAISVALARRDARVVALDRSARAVQVSRCNAQRLRAAHVAVVRGDLLAPLRGPVDAVLANLPYLTSREMRRLPPALRREPRAALDGGPDGLALYRRLLPQAATLLRAGGLCAFEIGPAQSRAARALAAATWPAARVGVVRDYAGRDRVVAVEL
ncbi:MAG: peptide chain release factor N(5)-glutamine methyltransferase [Chloroflexi bacterium]|nr:peptide chain release factor N(5)-glutamine methyltransferase [Chloroflexota bacterium]